MQRPDDEHPADVYLGGKDRPRAPRRSGKDPVDVMTVTVRKVGVIGSGQMGNGIAHVAALAGLDVVLNDISADRLKSAMATINGNLSRQVAKQHIT